MDKNAVINQDAERIKELGGPAKVAQLLGFGEFGTQRVQNWIKRGIPPAVKVAHPELFLRLAKAA